MGDRQYEYLIGVLNINRCHEYINRCREYIICIQILTYCTVSTGYESFKGRSDSVSCWPIVSILTLSLSLTRICINISTVYNDTLIAKGLKEDPTVCPIVPLDLWQNITFICQLLDLKFSSHVHNMDI